MPVYAYHMLSRSLYIYICHYMPLYAIIYLLYATICRYMPIICQYFMLSFILVHGIFFEATSHENGILKPQRAATSLVPPTQRSHQWEHVICVYGKHWQNTMERSTRFETFWWEKSLYFDWAIFKSPVQSLPEGMSVYGGILQPSFITRGRFTAKSAEQIDMTHVHLFRTRTIHVQCV